MKVYEKLINVQNELKAPKSQFNSFGKYNYRSCEDILEALKPVCLKHKAATFISDEVVEIGSRQYVKAIVTFVDIETGESIQTNALAREEETKKGMDGSQVTGASSSYARKYALNGMFCIDDTKDSDSTNTHGKEEQPRGITDNQYKRLLAIANKKGITPQRVAATTKADYNKADPKDLTQVEYDKLIQKIEKLADKQ